MRFARTRTKAPLVFYRINRKTHLENLAKLRE